MWFGGGCSESDSYLLESLQIEDARVVTGALKRTNRVSLLKKFLGSILVLEENFINSV